MSGPKLIELRRMQAARERQRNHDRCAAFGSEYARLLEEYHQWGNKLRELKVSTADVIRPLDRVRTEIDELLRQESHHEAARIFGEQVSRLRGEVENRRQIFQERLVTLQNRHRQLYRDLESISDHLSLLREKLKSALPATWPQQEQERIRVLIEQALGKIICPTAPEFPNDAENISRFEETEATAKNSLAALQALEQQLETELNKTHQQLLTSSLSHQTSTAPNLAEVLQRLSTAAKAKPADSGEKPVLEIEKLCAELAVIGDETFLAEARARTKEIYSTPEPSRRRLLTESLLIDGGVYLKEQRELLRWREEIQKLIDSTAHVKDTEVESVIGELRALLSSKNRKELGPFVARLRETLSIAEAKRERAFRRKALIDSLQELGYETHDSLETAFVKEGKVVLHRPGEEDYGVEMVANSDLNQVQTALVRYANSEDLTDQQRRRDLEREEAWCADHARLRSRMAARGLETPFKMQLKPGEHPVKVVVDKNRAGQSRSTSRGTERSRQP